MNFKLADSTLEKVPSKLEKLVTCVKSKKLVMNTVHRDIFLTLIIYIMNENGFHLTVVDNNETNDIQIFNEEQLFYNKSNSEVIEMAYVLGGIDDIQVKLIASPLGSTYLINVFVSDVSKEVYSICLPISQYVVSPQAPTIPMIFNDLRQLSQIFRNKIITPVKSLILKHCGYCSASLLGIPEELVIKIFLNLSINDILCTTKTCKRLALLLDNTNLWHKLFIRDFKYEITNDSIKENDWKKMYKDAHIAKGNTGTRLTTNFGGTLHDYMDFSDFVSYIDNPLWDVII